MKDKERNIEKHLEGLSEQELKSLGDAIKDLQDDGEINGSVNNYAPDDDKKETVIIREKTVKKRGGALKFIIIGIVIALLAVGAFMLFRKPKVTVTYSASTLLEEIKEINELVTAAYTYNGVATAYDENGEVKYYVGYYGTVNTGINLADVAIDVNNDENIITITMPEIQVFDLSANIDSAEFMFANNSYNKEGVVAEANQIAKADLEKKVSEDKKLQSAAYDNAIDVMTAWGEALTAGSQYKVVVQ